MGRLTSGEVEFPRFSATIASALLIGSASLYGVVLGGHGASVAQAVSARSGFAIEDIKVTGNRQTSELDIFDRIGLDGWTALIGFDAGEARDRIAGLPWIEQVAVRKVYPSTLEVDIVERQAFAVWQQGRQLAVIDAAGQSIAPTAGRRHANLPLVIGQGAAEAGKEFLAVMEKHPELAARAMGYILIAERRWDVRLDNGVTIQLPEDGVDRALRDIVELDRQHGIFSRDIVSVDMRFPDRLILRLTPEAKETRDAALKNRAGASGTGRRT
ncbi:FtsQ-type POTRA domain-containing protein [Chelativorans sp. ZYF759]|uniref:cell division protein FtsQ/DivIB n=1 Tax=Chelativorans sp. ZYF759 TaxID=2692213 RepID=UPI00145DC209|nr:cell division protein FtsQ/DivIB [Chelativorans sp. ZYF759]NMG41500.1 FtsQ-type POTRA domain-containing protein [Chelativorans sp. ZYF759]